MYDYNGFDVNIFFIMIIYVFIDIMYCNYDVY